ncbi:MAG TPA: MFS transporter [Gaiellaceae bacterium]
MATPEPPGSETTPAEPWFVPGVKAIGAASLLSDLGHEVPTSLLPSFLSATLHAPASALGLIEGIADLSAGVARLAGGPLADDPERRTRTAVGGYLSTAVFSSAIGVAGAAWQVGVLRSVAWASRGIRGPSRNALLAEMVPKAAYGRAYGFERAMDNLGAIGGPLLALGLVAIVGVRTAIVVSIVPGALAAAAIVAAVRAAPRHPASERRALRIHVRAVLSGRVGRLVAGIAAFELANVAATALILRATGVLDADHSHAASVKIALGLYAGYNLAATVIAVPGGHLVDRRGPVIVLVLGATAFVASFAGFAFAGGGDILVLALLFAAGGVGIGLAETAQSAAVAAYSPPELRGSAFGLVAAMQALANFASSAAWGVIYTAISPRAAFLYLAGWSAVAAVAFAASRVSAPPA